MSNWHRSETEMHVKSQMSQEHGVEEVSPDIERVDDSKFPITETKCLAVKGENLASQSTAASEWIQDSRNPLNWSILHKWLVIVLLTVTNFITSMSTTSFEPILPAIMNSLSADSPSLESFTISVYTLGYFIGPLIAAPISEYYGRTTVLQPSYVIYLVSLAICGSTKSIVAFVVFRAIMGTVGVSFVLLGPAVISDIMQREQRGLAISVMSMGPSIGPTLGPFIGGYIAQSLGWRWIFWITIIILGLLAMCSFLFMRETYDPVLRRRLGYQDANPGQADIARHEAIRAAAVRPLKMLFRSPIILIMALYAVLANSYLMIVMSTLGTVTQDVYGITAGQSGLLYLGLTVGFLLAQFSLGAFSDRYVSYLAKQHGGERKPEFRLPPLVIAAAIFPGSLFFYGWVLEYHVHWIGVAIAMAIFALGMLMSYLPVQMYIVDAFTVYAASANAACAIPRAICSALVPLGANPLYSKLGYGWGNSVLAFIAVAFGPFALLLYKYGERLRTHPKFQPSF